MIEPYLNPSPEAAGAVISALVAITAGLLVWLGLFADDAVVAAFAVTLVDPVARCFRAARQFLKQTPRARTSGSSREGTDPPERRGGA